MKTSTVVGQIAFALALASCATPQGQAPTALSVPSSSISLAAADGRDVPITIVPASEARGVILLSHGGGNDPAGMLPVMQQLAANGFTVIAPMHTDSRSMSADRRTDLQGAFPTRIADLQAAAGFAAQQYPDLPLGLFGYSYGSLIALVGGGAFAGMMPGKIPAAKAVVMFSSPGPVEGLTTQSNAFAAVDVPTLLVTGTADTVPGFVPDPAMHLMYFDRLPTGDHTLLLVKNGTHGFLRGERGIDIVAPLALDFLKSRVLGDAEARARFDAAQSGPVVEVRRR